MIHPAIRDWVDAHLGGEAAASMEALPWAFSTPTAVAVLADGSRRVIQLLAAPTGAARTDAGARLLRGAGIRVPRILDSMSWQGATILVTEHLSGTPAAALIGKPDAQAMARAMGQTAAVLRSYQTRGDAQGTWASPNALIHASATWEVDSPGSVLHRAVLVVADHAWTPTLSHGDYVPANALIEGDSVAVVDLGDVGHRHPLVDVAWWCLMVRHHHRADAAALIPPFLRSAGVDERSTARKLSSVALVRSAELAHAEPGRSQLERLFHAAVAWADGAGM